MGSECENHLFIKFKTNDHREHIIAILSNGIKLFESFIILQGTKLECYGTSSDVYIEYIHIDIDIDPLIIKLEFTTYESAPLRFCKSISFHYNLDIHLIYFNEKNNYSGRFCIDSNRLIKDEIYSYYQGIYIHDRDRFWNEIEIHIQELKKEITYETYIENINLSLSDMDTVNLKNVFNKYQLFKKFENL